MDQKTIRTKTIINKMFDVLMEKGLNIDNTVANIFENYYESLISKKYFEFDKEHNKKNSEDFVHSVARWKSFTEPTLPSSYEKYLILAELFCSEVSNIVCTEYDDPSKKDFNFNFIVKVEQLESGDSQKIYLPIIRENPNNFTNNNQNSRSIYTHIYSNNVEKYDFLASMMDERSVSIDGITLISRVVNWAQKNNLDVDILDIKKKVKSAYRNWLNGKANSAEQWMLFCMVTEEDPKFLFNQQNLAVNLSGIVLPKKANTTCKFDRSLLDKAEFRMEEDNIRCVKKGLDYYITKNNEGKYGIIVFKGNFAYYVQNEYDYIVKSKQKIIALQNNTFFEFDTENLPLFTSTGGAVAKVSFSRFVDVSKFRNEIELSLLLKRFFVYEDEGGTNVFDAWTKKVHSVIKINNQGDLISISESGRLYGYLKGGIFIPPEYDEKVKCKNGIYVVCKDGKYGFYNSFGFLVCEPTFNYISNLSEDLIAVKKGDYYGYINANNETIIDFELEMASDFKEGLASVKKNGEIGYINKDGQIKYEMQFERIYNFSENVAVVEKDGKYGMINKNGNVIIPLEYDDATSCINGVVTLVKDNEIIKKRVVL